MGRGRGTGALGTRGRWSWRRGTEKAGVRDAGTQDSGTWDVGNRRRDKQTTPDFCAEFVKYNLR